MAGVARSWYSKAANKNPSVGRLYHHLAILARPNAFQQLYYYSRSLTCVKPFARARESILTLFETSRAPCTYYDGCIMNFIQVHGVLFEKLSALQFWDARYAFQRPLFEHIGRVTAKWKEQGVYIAVTNIAGLFDYGSDGSILRHILQLHAKDVLRNRPVTTSSQAGEGPSRSSSPTTVNPAASSIAEYEIPAKLEDLSQDFTFARAYVLTTTTLSLVLHRIGDKNVLPYVHILLSFLSSFASIKYIAHLIDLAPWHELVTFLNALPISERPEQLIPGPIFPTDQTDSQPLPEDYLIRGQIWSQWYFPEDWFAREYDEEELCQELASTIKSRTERILLISYHISTFNRWISYDLHSHAFSIISEEEIAISNLRARFEALNI